MQNAGYSTNDFFQRGPPLGPVPDFLPEADLQELEELTREVEGEEDIEIHVELDGGSDLE